MIGTRIAAPLAGLLAVLWELTMPAAQAQSLPKIGSLRFEPCVLEAPGSVRTRAAGCTRLEVAEAVDAGIDGRRLALHLAVVPSDDPVPEPDPLVLIAGGPGQSAIDAWFAVEYGLSLVSRRRNVLLLDQRGTGRSNPLPCAQKLLADGDRLHWRQRAAETARECAETLSDHADLRYYSSSDAVRDLEALRVASGQQQLNLYAGSYGTRVALEYARRYPSRVRSMILDGVVPPELVLGQEHGINLDAALDVIFAACRQDPACAERYGDPEATLANLLQRTAESPQDLRVPDPRSHAPVDEHLDRDTIVAVLRFLAYQPEFASLLPLLIDETWEGRPGPLVSQGLMVMQRLSTGLMHGMELSVICTEDVDLMTLDERAQQTRMGTIIQELFAVQCAEWPKASRPADFHQPVVSAAPTLLLSGSWDPVTPPRYAESVLAQLSNARHIVVQGRGHIVLTAGCMPAVASAFLDTLKPKELRLGCLEKLKPPGFFVDFYGPEP